MKKIVLIGTGNIASVHAEALRATQGVEIAGVFDVDQARAQDFAGRYKIDQVFKSFDAVLADEAVTGAHVLTPPPLHQETALPLLSAGKTVLIEKPIAHCQAAARTLMEASRKHGAALRTNQNFIFHPAHRKLRKALDNNRLGPIRRAHCTYVMPLRQLAARRFGHWMFAAPVNLLLEQAVHPLSQVEDVMGNLSLEQVVPGTAQEYAPGIELITQWDLIFSSPKGPVTMQIALGESYPDWSLTLLGDDGSITADYLHGGISVKTPGAYLDVIEDLRLGMAQGAGTMAQSIGSMVHYLLAQAKLVERGDPFYRSILGSVRDFYAALDTKSHDCDGARGTRLVTLCEEIAARTPSLKTTPVPHLWTEKKPVDCVVLGGTGFIGQAVVRKLAAAGKSVRVAARNTERLSEDFEREAVEIARGSVTDRVFLEAVMEGAECVINLAHGGGGATFEEIRKALVGSATLVAETARARGVKKLLHVSSIAALYLGDPDKVIRHTALADPDKEKRGDYARAKAEAEEFLIKSCAQEGMAIGIFRPGIVVGAGASPFHSGVGLFNRERYCLGWNRGKNPLPFVLVEDVAEALVKAAFEVSPEKINGFSFNIVGDVRMTAREYIAALARETQRPLRYRPQYVLAQQSGEIIKWIMKIIGRRRVPFPSLRDLKSRGMPSAFDISFEKTQLGWSPVADRNEFIDKAIKVHCR